MWCRKFSREGEEGGGGGWGGGGNVLVGRGVQSTVCPFVFHM